MFCAFTYRFAAHHLNSLLTPQEVLLLVVPGSPSRACVTLTLSLVGKKQHLAPSSPNKRPVYLILSVQVHLENRPDIFFFFLPF